MKKYAAVLCLLFALSSWPSHAVDFGLIVDQSAGYGGVASGAAADYTGAFVPRFSALIGGAADIYISAGLIIEHGSGAARFVPELLRTEFTWLFGIGGLKAGRMYYSDPLGFIANGLFDGARVSFYTTLGTFSAGAWYTGLLYKRRADITMTPREVEAYAVEPFNDFANTYFAPRRVAAALEWEHLSLGGALQARAAVIGQFDTGGGLHSQYIEAKGTLPLLRAVTFDMGGCLELIQNDGTFGIAGAAELGIQAALPTPLRDRLSFTARYSSGGFLPLTTREQGDILRARLSGLSLLSLDYTARLFPTLAAGVSSTYFIRSDLETYTAYPVTVDSGGYALGNEFFARLMWNPFSDLELSLGGGVFLPSLGDAAPGAAAAWRVELNLIFGL